MSRTTAPHLAPPVAAGLANLLAVVGDNKYWLGRHLSEWSVGTPGLESAVACAAIAQGHLGQSRAVFPLADELAGDAVDLGHPDERTKRFNMAALDAPFATWAQAVATLYLVDPALDIVMRSLGPLSDELDRRVARILDESGFNADFARGRVVELTERYPNGRAQLTPHLRPVMTEVLCWFGPSDEPGVTALRDAGALTAGNDAMRDRYRAAVVPLLEELGYGDEVAGTEELPWDRWNGLQRRL